jgi:uncharacterized protein YigE (DUF2233 family)
MPATFVRELAGTARLACIASLFATSSLLWANRPASPADTLPAVARNVESVAEGVEHVHEFHTSGPLNVHLLKVDLGTSGISVGAALGRGRLFTGATVEEMAMAAERPDRHVLGAINADFWKNSPAMFTPVNIFVADGMTARLPSAPAPRAVFGRTHDGSFFMRPLTARLSVSAQGRRLSQVKLNEPVTSSGAVLYDRLFGREISLKRFRRAYALELEGDRFVPNEPVTARVVEALELTSATVSGRKLVLGLHSGAASALGRLAPGSEVQLRLTVPEIKGPIELAVGGGPMLLRDGRLGIDWRQEKMIENFAADNQPRTAAGLSKDGKTLVLMTVDGRQPAVSVGMSLYELALYLREAGCWTAMNFDGGGSTTMVVRGDVVNRPCDRLGPRRVVNAILVLEEGPTGPLHMLELLPRDFVLKVPAGARTMLTCRGRDSRGNPVQLLPEFVRWQGSGEVGTLSAAGTTCTLTAAARPTTGTVTVRYEDARSSGTQPSTQKTVAVVELTTITVEPAPLVLSSGEDVLLNIAAETKEGPLHVDNSMVELIPGDDVVTVTRQRLHARRRGEGCLEVGVGTFRTHVPYYVDEATTVTICGFDDDLTTKLLGTRFDAKKTAVRLEKKRQREGRGCLAWRYAMTYGGTTRVVLPVNLRIDGQPAKLSVWIYGDGKEAWLRGEAVDARGQRFLVDFTNGSEGIYWKNQWRRVEIPMHSLVPRPTNAGAKPVFPLRITQLYLAQDQEALKAQGEILLDRLEAIYPPASSGLKCPDAAH